MSDFGIAFSPGLRLTEGGWEVWKIQTLKTHAGLGFDEGAVSVLAATLSA